MKKHFVRILSILLAFSFTFCVAHASTRASQYIYKYDALSVASDETITVYFEISGTSVMSKIGASTIVIERYNGNDWDPVRTFSSGSTTGMTGSSVKSYSGSVAYDATVSGSYRAVVTVFTTLNGGTDSRTVTTNTVTVVCNP